MKKTYYGEQMAVGGKKEVNSRELKVERKMKDLTQIGGLQAGCW
jgi:hypothetical protein